MEKAQEFINRATQIRRDIKQLQADLDGAKEDFKTATIAEARQLQTLLFHIARLAEALRWTDCGLQFRSWY